MPSEDVHLSDQEMLLAADGELSTRRAARVRAHLAACWACRGRMAEIEKTIAALAGACRCTLDSRLPAISGPRSLLRARLAELASKHEVQPVAEVTQPQLGQGRGGDSSFSERREPARFFV